ncbi:MAG: OmpA family protein, partial [Catalinimonas sp.]
MKQLRTVWCMLLLFTPAVLSAQEVQWASEVLDFSSELSEREYSARQILGEPDVLPAGGESPNSWVPKNEDKRNSIKVGFEKPMRIQQVAVAEAFNPGSVYQVFAYDGDDKEYLINTFSPRPITRAARMFNIFFNETPYQVSAIKIVIEGKAVPGYNAIDAIGIANTRTPIEAEVNVLDSISANLVVDRLSDNVNSEYKELKPLISPDGKTMYFSRRNHPENVGGVDDPEDIWYSEMSSDGEWQKAKNLGPPLNTEGPNFVSSITSDGETMVMVLGNQYGSNGKMRAGVSISRRGADGGFEEPKNLEIKNMYNFNEKANFFMANSQKVMLMSIEREDSRGGRDLYVIFEQEDGDWSEPLNVGDDLNTAGEESSPFLAADERTLYFSSEGHSGYGGSDIYATRRIDDTWTNWTEPENLGPEINSPGEDIFFNLPVNSDYAYYSRGVSETEADIYRIKMPVIVQPSRVVIVYGKTLDVESNEPVAATIYYEDLATGEEKGRDASNSTTGDYQVELPTSARYGYRAEAEGYYPLSANLDLTGIGSQRPDTVEQNLYLVPLGDTSDTTGPVPITLNNVFFDFNKST